MSRLAKVAITVSVSVIVTFIAAENIPPSPMPIRKSPPVTIRRASIQAPTAPRSCLRRIPRIGIRHRGPTSIRRREITRPDTTVIITPQDISDISGFFRSVRSSRHVGHGDRLRNRSEAKSGPCGRLAPPREGRRRGTGCWRRYGGGSFPR